MNGEKERTQQAVSLRRSANLPGQRKTDGLVDRLIEETKPIFEKRVGELKRLIERLAYPDEIEKLSQTFDAEFVSSVGETIFGGSVVAGEAGRAEILKRRMKDEGGRMKPETRFRAATNWQAEVRDYSGPAIEVDFFRLRSFTMAHVTDAGILQALKDELQKVLEGGGTFQDFRSRAVDLLGEAASENHLRTVYATNLHTAYNAGKYYQGMDAIVELPYWQYITMDDGKVRPAHQILHGRVWRKDDAIWDTIYPPNGFNCRCSVLEHDEYSLQEEGLTSESGGHFRVDEGFERNAALDAGLLQELARQWDLAERLWTDYRLAALQAQTAPAAAILPEVVNDSEGLLRTIPAGLAAQYGDQGSLIEMTLREPAEIWGWPGRNLYYIASYETAGGVISVAVEVWGDVKEVHIISGGADEWRKGMLLKKG